MHPKYSYISMSKWPFFILLFCMVAAFAADSNPEQADSDSPEDNRRPTVELVILNPSAIVTNAIDFEVTVSNPTSLDYAVENILIYFPGTLVETRQSIMVRPSDDCDSNQLGAKLTTDGAFDLGCSSSDTLSAGSIRVFRGALPAYKRPFIDTLFDVSTFLFVPGDFPVRAQVKMHRSDKENVTEYPTAKTVIHLQAPLSASLRGGLLGAILLALFVPAFDFLQKLQNIKKLQSIRETIWGLLTYLLGQTFNILFFALSGCVVATAGILVIFRLGSSDFPITIQITDWLGGLIVGLFSYTIGKKLHSMFFPQNISDRTIGNKTTNDVADNNTTGNDVINQTPNDVANETS